MYVYSRGGPFLRMVISTSFYVVFVFIYFCDKNKYIYLYVILFLFNYIDYYVRLTRDNRILTTSYAYRREAV